MMADLILPDHTYLEKMADIVWPAGLQYPLYALSQPVVKPLYRTRHSGDVFISLAQRIGGTVSDSFGWEHFEEAIKESGAVITYDEMPTLNVDRTQFLQLFQGCLPNNGRHTIELESLHTFSLAALPRCNI